MRDEVERYGHFSLAAESMYDPPLPVGLEAHGAGPRPGRRQVLGRVAPGPPEGPEVGRAGLHHAGVSVPSTGRSTPDAIAADLKANRAVGVPYTDEMIANARADVLIQASADDPTSAEFQKRYPNAAARDFDGDRGIPCLVHTLPDYIGGAVPWSRETAISLPARD